MMQKRTSLRWIGVLALLLAGVALAWWAWPLVFPDPIRQGTIAYERGDWAEAEALAREHLKEHGDGREALRLLARSLARQGQEDLAQNIFDRLGAGAMEAEDYYLIGASHLRAGDLPLARSAFEIAEQRDPDHAETLATFGDLFLVSGKFENASEYAHRLGRQPGWEGVAKLLLGRARQELLDPKGAVEAFQQTLERDAELRRSPVTLDVARKLLARGLLAEHRANEARDQLQAIDEPDPETHWLLSRAFLQLEDPDSAALERALAKEYGSDDPTTFEPAPYVGSKTCAECHSTITHDQTHSRHGRTFAQSPNLPDLPLPDEPIRDPHDPTVQHRFRREGDRVIVEALTPNQPGFG